jgi:hypothetical protein
MTGMKIRLFINEPRLKNNVVRFFNIRWRDRQPSILMPQFARGVVTENSRRHTTRPYSPAG